MHRTVQRRPQLGEAKHLKRRELKERLRRWAQLLRPLSLRRLDHHQSKKIVSRTYCTHLRNIYLIISKHSIVNEDALCEENTETLAQPYALQPRRAVCTSLYRFSGSGHSNH